MIKGILLDLSGVLYTGSEAIEGAADALQRLRNTGLPVRYVTNTTRSRRTDIVHKLGRMGFTVQEEEIFTAPSAARDYLESRGLSAYLLVHPDLRPELEDLADDRPGAVLVGDAGEGFTYTRMNEAFRLLMDGAQLVAMGRNRYFKEEDGLSLDAGPFISALEYAADTEATITGKPAKAFFHAACADLGCNPADVVMVGDDVEADVNGATRAGLQGILVTTGKYRDGDESRLEDPNAVALDNFPAFVDWVLESH